MQPLSSKENISSVTEELTEGIIDRLTITPDEKNILRYLFQNPDKAMEISQVIQQSSANPSIAISF